MHQDRIGDNMSNKDKDLKYLVKSNNYVGLLFFALVFASILYIFRYEGSGFKELAPIHKEVEIGDIPLVFDEKNDEIDNYIMYLNVGNDNTYRSYQSNYVLESISVDDIDSESLLYMAFRYLINNSLYNNTRNITCEEAKIVNLDGFIKECGGFNNSLNDYKVYYSIDKKLITNTIKDLYNINFNEYSDFYINDKNKCYFVDDEYFCVDSFNEVNSNHGETSFIKTLYYEDKIEIIEKYKYIKDGISYKGFNSEVEGEEYYISTFVKVNDKFYYSNTNVYEEN